MKRVLIITYYWPPSGGSGVQRWLKMSKYFPENGWQPVIYTTEGAEYPIEDPTLEKDVAPEAEVIRRPIIEPYTFYKKFTGMKKGDKVKAGFTTEEAKKSSWKDKLSIWIRGNLFIPDARCWWIRPSVRYLKKYLKEHPVDAIISTGPPHSMHLIALKLHKKLNIPWIADFRDPWTEIDFYQDLHLSRWADRKHHRLEKQVLTQADKVVTVGWDWAEGLKRHGAPQVDVILNGYDWSLEPSEQQIPLSQEFTLSHIGLLGPTRNNPIFWQALGELVNESEELKQHLNIQLIGQVDNSAIKSIEQTGLNDYVTHLPHIPHDEVMQKQCASQVLLLFVNNTPNAKGIMTGKLFEYFSSGRPILCIGPEDGDAAHIISEVKAGVTIGFDDKEKMKKHIMYLFEKYKSGSLDGNSNMSIDKYSRKELSKQYATIIDHLTSNKQS